MPNLDDLTVTVNIANEIQAIADLLYAARPFSIGRMSDSRWCVQFDDEPDCYHMGIDDNYTILDALKAARAEVENDETVTRAIYVTSKAPRAALRSKRGK